MAEEELLFVRELGAEVQSCSQQLAQKEEEEPTRADPDREDVASRVLPAEPRQTDTEEADGQSGTVGDINSKTHAVDKQEKAWRSHDEEEEVSQSDPPEPLDQNQQDSSKWQTVGQEARRQAPRLTPDFPEALYELLCTLQEGRRLNDQRCSFRLDGAVPRRRCHSEPNTNKPASRVVFSSMTSLQKEEFFELVATAQGRRLDDQRAKLGRRPPPKPKGRSFRGSIKQLSFIRKPAAAPGPNEDLYNMILTTQAQGRLEDQRSRAPGPMDDEDFFSLLLRVQGGRMEEQRTEPPLVLLHAANLHV